jgi:uncharacterized membrane protein YeiB
MILVIGFFGVWGINTSGNARCSLLPWGDILLLYAVVGVVLFVVQLRCSIWWARKYGQGPLERLWHKWTWLGA